MQKYLNERCDKLEKEGEVNAIRLMFLNEIVNNISGEMNLTNSKTINKSDIRDHIQLGIGHMNNLVKEQHEINNKV